MRVNSFEQALCNEAALEKKILGQHFEVRGALLHVSSEFNKCNIGWLIDRLDKVSW